jgi:hypothetical protein
MVLAAETSFPKRDLQIGIETFYILFSHLCLPDIYWPISISLIRIYYKRQLTLRTL